MFRRFNSFTIPMACLRRCTLAFLTLGVLSTAAHGQITLYEHDNFGGRVYRSGASVRNLTDVGFNDRASSVVVRNGRWQVCSDAEFRGQCTTLDPGEYPSLRSVGLNDRLSSVRDLGPAQDGWGGGWSSARITLYENDDFNGRSVPASGNLADLANFGFNDRASSVRIRDGQWQLCVDSNYRGSCITLGPGEYRSLRAMSMNDRISSVRDLGSTPSGGTAAQLPGYGALQGRERGYCKLTNTANGRDLYKGACAIKQTVGVGQNQFAIRLGSGEPYTFAMRGAGWEFVDKRGVSQPARFRDMGRSAVFGWGNFRLEVEEDV
jgi:hypothetical protein